MGCVSFPRVGSPQGHPEPRGRPGTLAEGGGEADGVGLSSCLGRGPRGPQHTMPPLRSRGAEGGGYPRWRWQKRLQCHARLQSLLFIPGGGWPFGTQAAFEETGMKALPSPPPCRTPGHPRGQPAPAPPPPASPPNPGPQPGASPARKSPTTGASCSRFLWASSAGNRGARGGSEPPAAAPSRRLRRGEGNRVADEAPGLTGAHARTPGCWMLGSSRELLGNLPALPRAKSRNIKGRRGQREPGQEPLVPASAQLHRPTVLPPPCARVPCWHTWVWGCAPPPFPRHGTQPIAVATATSSGCIFCTGAAVGTWTGATSFRSGSLGRLCSRHRAQLAAASSPDSPCPTRVVAPAGGGSGGRGFFSDPQHGAVRSPPRSPRLWAGSSEAKRERPPRLPRARAVPAAPGVAEPLPKHLGPQGDVPPPLPLA